MTGYFSAGLAARGILKVYKIANESKNAILLVRYDKVETSHALIMQTSNKVYRLMYIGHSTLCRTRQFEHYESFATQVDLFNFLELKARGAIIL